MTDTLSGRTIGKYQLLEKLGRGGMAEVYKGYQESLDRYVAIKLMHAFLVSEQDFLQRFKREAKAMASLRHPNIVAIYDFDVYRDDIYYLVMEYVSGGTLKQKLEELAQRQEALSLERAVQIALQVAEALEYAHSRGMVHRDVKPANIMLNEDSRAILTDFGIVKLVGGQSMAYTATGALIGTPSYMSPEQAMGKPGDERVDIYALGVLLFQMTTGQLPFSADTPLAVIMQHVNTPIPEPVRFNPNVPPALQDIILNAMAKEPENRYRTAKIMADDLRALRFLPGDKSGSSVAPVGQLSALSGGAMESPTEPTAVVPDTTAGVPDTTAGVPDTTAVVPDTTAVVAEPAAGGAEPTAAVGGMTAVSTPAPFVSTEWITPPATPPPATPQPPLAAEAGKKRAVWPLMVVGLLLLGLISGGIWALNGRANEPAEPVTAAAGPTAADTQTPPATEEPATATLPPPAPTLLVVVASEEATAVIPTASATATKKATAVPTPDATAAALAACTPDARLVNVFTFQNPRAKTAPVNAPFPVNWVLQNSGTCPWPDNLNWAHQSGETFAFTGNPIRLNTAVQPGESITLTASFVAPAAAGSYQSVWSLVDASSKPFGPELTFSLEAYVPATATPTATPTPEATVTAVASPTSDQPTTLIWIAQSCEYIGTEWRCQVQITPYGGGGGPYTVWVFDADQPAEYRGAGPFYHFAKARRCAAYNHEVRVQDDATGTAQSQQIFIDPNLAIPGGCTLP
ncbi:MAG: protein kinase [Chloroflexi bacterium]|nr:protein kinase [Chloroflexota bacterium]